MNKPPGTPRTFGARQDVTRHGVSRVTDVATPRLCPLSGHITAAERCIIHVFVNNPG